jgi:hypothetical protein
MKKLFSFPETYSFRCNKNSEVKIFRYPNNSTIDISNLQIRDMSLADASIDLSDKKIGISIVELENVKKPPKYYGVLTNYGEDVVISVAYETKQHTALINSLEGNTSSFDNLIFVAEIPEDEAKKKVDKSITKYLIESFKIIHQLK